MLSGKQDSIKDYFLSLCYDLTCDPIYQPLRSGRIWHKVNF